MQARTRTLIQNSNPNASLKECQIVIKSYPILIHRLYLVNLNQPWSKQCLKSDSICTRERSRSNSHSSNSQAIEKIGSEGEEDIKGDNGAGDLDVLQWSRDRSVLSVDELNTKCVPVVATERGTGTEWGAVWQTGDFKGGDIEVEG